MTSPTKSHSSPSHHGVVVTVDMESHLLPTIELAVALAADRQISLHGQFVEDVDLLSVARLPFAQEVPLLGGQPRALENRGLQQSFDKLADRFRQALTEHARRFSLTCSYSTVSGRRQSMELSESANADFVIVGQPAHSGKPHTPRILLLTDDHPLPSTAIEVILARIGNQQAQLLVATAPGSSPRDRNQELAELLKKHPGTSALPLDPERAEQLLITRRLAADYIVTTRKLNPDHLRRLLLAATCPIIVVS